MRLSLGLACSALFLSACGSTPFQQQSPPPAGTGVVVGGIGTPAPVEEPGLANEPVTLASASPASAEPRYVQREPTTGSAVRSLMQTAEQQSSSGDSTAAAATLERALRIEPRNPLLLSRLASVRHGQGQYQRAVNFAAKSNSVAGGNQGLKRDNWQLIARSRRALGDEPGAREAELKANETY